MVNHNLNACLNLWYFSNYCCAARIIGSPNSIGYISQSTQSSQSSGATVVPTTVSINLNMRSVTTAIAVNTGMLSLSTLVNVSDDQVRTQLLDTMVQYGYISQKTASMTSSYFDPFYSPLPNIYCTSYANAPPQCK
jgi:hypothetical protein